MEYIIGGIAVIICIFLAGYLWKKKYYKETDRLEEWKIEINNRPVLDELQKVKKLNMNGETEERFERWRSAWDEIISAKLPDLEELLFDAEDFIDRYQFKKAKAVQEEISDTLTKINKEIDELLLELSDLIGSEEKNRVEIENLKEIYRESKRNLLAHRHLYGNMEKYLEEKLESVSEQFSQYDENTEKGNYLRAREIVLSIHTVLNKTKSDMDLIPNILVELQSTIPSQLKDIMEGYKEMLLEGFGLEHIQLEAEIERISKDLEDTVAQFEQLEMIDIQAKINAWKECIDQLYDRLEQEVLAKHELKQRDKEILEMLQTAKKVNLELNDEFIQIQSSYHLQDSDMKMLEKLAKRINQLSDRFNLIQNKWEQNNPAYSQINDELSAVKQMLDDIVEEQTGFAEKLQTLRKDELAARNQVKELKRQIAETIRLVSKSNIPGVPQDYKYLLEDAQESIEQVADKLEEKPLDIPVIQEYLEVAVLTVGKVTKRTDDLFETVMLAEKIIQYGNRYRSKYPSVDKELGAAENYFRHYDYKEALEQAAATIEKIEPGSLKKIEEMLKEDDE